MIFLACSKCGTRLYTSRSDNVGVPVDEPTVIVEPCRGCGTELKQIKQTLNNLFRAVGES